MKILKNHTYIIRTKEAFDCFLKELVSQGLSSECAYLWGWKDSRFFNGNGVVLSTADSGIKWGVYPFYIGNNIEDAKVYFKTNMASIYRHYTIVFYKCTKILKYNKEIL